MKPKTKAPTAYLSFVASVTQAKVGWPVSDIWQINAVVKFYNRLENIRFFVLIWHLVT